MLWYNHSFAQICFFIGNGSPMRDMAHGPLNHSHYRWNATNIELYSALMAIKQWGFFNMPQLLWHEPTLYDGRWQGLVTLTPIAERSAVEQSWPVLMFLSMSRSGIKSTIPACEANAPPLSHTRCLTLWKSYSIWMKLWKTGVKKFSWIMHGLVLSVLNTYTCIVNKWTDVNNILLGK